MSNPNPSKDTRFKPGQSGNPGGRKKGTGIKGMMNKIGEEWSASKSTMTKMEYVCRKIWDHAAKGEKWAVDIVFDRMEGKPRQVIEMATEDEEIGAMSDEQLVNFFNRDEN